MKKKIGIIGHTGRMGKCLDQLLNDHPHFVKGIFFNRSTPQKTDLHSVFEHSDYVVDFSHCALTPSVLTSALSYPKPLILCTTGWSWEKLKPSILSLCEKIPLIIVPNTSISAYIHRRLVEHVAKILGDDYDIDVVEKHHRHKKDIPSGTAISLVEGIKKIKKEFYHQDYKESIITEGSRPNHTVAMHAHRNGITAGEHEVIFTSNHDMISITHKVFDHTLFAQGALRIVQWLQDTQPENGLYTMDEIMKNN
jgi:4-hydroxy-tetrahydrodipicolinate reductase